MATFVLVPGFWLGGWVWEAVAARLRGAGHEVHAVTLAGLAERAGEASPQVDVDAHVRDLVSLVEGRGLREVVLVGHSGAHMPVAGAVDVLAARSPGRVARVVYVDTAPMPSGMASLDFGPPGERAEVERRAAEEGGGWLIPVPRFVPAEGPSLEGLSAADLEALRTRGTPQPLATATQALRRPDPLPPVPSTMVACSMPVAAVRAMVASGAPVFAPMAGPEWEFRELATGHWPMLSEPAALAGLLAEISERGPSVRGVCGRG
ncbi:alpha/beta hydrolase [Actinomadura sp. PM05-2]|uniref:Alpha/beta hydrolase n=1 Tax=Actinomadura parmotrematis TaxID=2864039 RepID=A0ABS7FQR9_9ACTN|nr:alpha/beta hydrolase [Actinomadura parmotrematis]